MPRVKRGTKRRQKRKKILDRASGYFLTKSKLYRSAKEAVERGLILREGTGRKNDPYRYWLPATEAKWREQYPFYDHFEQQRREHKWRWISLQERKRISRDEARLETIGPDPADNGDDGDGDVEPA